MTAAPPDQAGWFERSKIEEEEDDDGAKDVNDYDDASDFEERTIKIE